MIFAELTDAHTGAKTIFPMEYFVFQRPSIVQAAMDKDGNVSRFVKVISIFNPVVGFEVKEEYEQIKALLTKGKKK